MRRLSSEERDILAGCASPLEHLWTPRETDTIWRLRARGLLTVRCAGGAATAYATALGRLALVCYAVSEPGMAAA